MSTIQVDTAMTFATKIPTTRATAAAEAQAAAAAASAEAAAAAEYELFCLVEGDQGPFSILTSSGTSIAQLKKLILVESATLLRLVISEVHVLRISFSRRCAISRSSCETPV